MKKDRYEYSTAVNGCVESEIVYKVVETDPLADNRVDSYSYKINNTEIAKTVNNYDTYKRVVSKQHIVDGKTFYKSIGYSGYRISAIMDSPGSSTFYQYDDFGKITTINSNNVPITYKYNSYGQLAREDNKVLDKTFVYKYNNHGCLTKVEEYAYATGTPSGTAVETAFTYDGTHPDRLTGFGGTSVSYNTMGCPTTVHGYNATWTRGKLARLSKGNLFTGSHSHSYSYNAFGQRITSSYTFTPGASNGSAVAIGTLTGYSKVFRYDQSGRLIYEGRTCQYYSEPGSSDNIVYLYDECGMIGMQHTDTLGVHNYYFQRNLLGDVIAIYDTSGTKVAGYAYDAWGNCTITLNTNGIATRNPIRYRGYYYDEDTGLYYLNARYYSPSWRRFISPDDTAYLDPETPNGLNLYCYCNNDPVNKYDPSGYAWETVFDIGFAIWSLVDFIREPTWANAGWFALDIVTLAVPFLPGGCKVITKANDLLDAVGFVKKYDDVIVLGQTMANRVIPYADEIGASIYKGVSNIDDLRKSYGIVASSFLGYADNMGFIINHSLAGAKFVDIGFDATRTLKGATGMKLFVEGMSVFTIYSEKFFAQLFRKKNLFRYFRHILF